MQPDIKPTCKLVNMEKVVVAVCCRHRHRRNRLISSLPWPRSSSSTAIHRQEWCKEQALREDFRAMMERQCEANERLDMAREDRHPHAFNDPTPAPCIDLTADDRPARGPGKKVVDLTRSGDICGTYYSVPLPTGRACSTCGSDFSMWQSPFAAMVCPV